MNWIPISDVDDAETIAQGSGIRELPRLIEAYGGKNWRKRKGFATIRFLISYVPQTDALQPTLSC